MIEPMSDERRFAISELRGLVIDRGGDAHIEHLKVLVSSLPESQGGLVRVADASSDGEQMSDERLATFREWLGTGARISAAEARELLAEVERLRAIVDTADG